MREQTKDETKTGKSAVTPGGSDAENTGEKMGANELTQDELSKISGGITKPYADELIEDELSKISVGMTKPYKDAY